MEAVDIRVCFIGDSFVAGVGDGEALGWTGRLVSRARMSGVNLTAYNLGVRRDTTAQASARLLVEVPPRLQEGEVVGVVFATGVNDTTITDGEGPPVQPTHAFLAFRSMLESCSSRRWPVFVVGPPPIEDQQQNLRIEWISKEMARLCAETGQPFVDTVGPLSGDPVWHTSVAGGDGAHPGAAGYARLADLIWPAFRPWLDGIRAERAAHQS